MTTRGYSLAKADYDIRLRKIEGQVRGIRRMVDEDAYCIDVLTQITAATRALQSVAMGLLDEHIRHCVKDASGQDDPEALGALIDEATQAIERLVKA